MPRSRKASAKKRAAACEGARSAPPSADFFAPELATLRDSPPKGDAWLHEVKWDGYRILTAIAGGEVSLWSRNALPWTAKVPAIARAAKALGLSSARLDGELIALTDGHPDFNALQRALSGDRTVAMKYMIFDVPYLEGYDLADVPLVERKATLDELLREAPAHLGFSNHVVGNGDRVFAMAEEQKLEGIVCKRATSVYRPGRGRDWLKVKRLEADEFAVVGYTAAKGARHGFGSLLLAKPAPHGEWEYIGRVGSGFTDDMLRDLAKAIAKDGSSEPSINHAGAAPRGAKWIQPTAVAEVYYRGIGNQGLLRQPSLKAMRSDKSPADLLDSDRKRETSTKRSAGRAHG